MRNRNRHLVPIEASQLTEALIYSEIRYLDSATDYRESLREPDVKIPPGEFVLQDDEQRFPWAELIFIVAAVAAIIILCFLQDALFS